MTSYHVDLETRVDHALEPEDLEALLDALHPYGAAVSGGLDDRLSASMTIGTAGTRPQDAAGALQRALQLLDDQVRIVAVERAQVSTEQAKDADLAGHHRRLPRMVTVADVATTLGITRQGARKVLQTDPTAPAPAMSTSLGDLYLQGEIEAWAAARGRPMPGRRSHEDLVREAGQRAHRSLTLADEQIRRRAEDPALQADPLTLRVHTHHLDHTDLAKVTATAEGLNKRGTRHGVQVLLVHDQTAQRETQQDLRATSAARQPDRSGQPGTPS